MPTLITRTPIIDDDGSMTVGTVFENEWKVELYDQIDLALAGVSAVSETSVTTITTPGTVDLVTADAQIRLVRAYPQSGDITIRQALYGNPGDLLIIQNVATANRVLLQHLYADAGAGQKLRNLATSAATPLAPGGAAIYQYDLTNEWFLISHDQGSAIAAPFVAGNFTTVGASTSWTLSGITHSYRVRGKSLFYHFQANATTISGTPSQLLIGNGNFGGFTLATGGYARTGYHNFTSSDVFLSGGGASIALARLDGSNFPAGASWYLYGTFTGELQ